MRAEIIFTAESDERRRIPLFTGKTYVAGRSRSCDIVLSHTKVSRKHVNLTLTDEGLEVEDLGSRNGTYVRGECLGKGQAMILENGDTVQVGGHSLTLRILTPETLLPLQLEGPDLEGYETLARIGKGAYSRVFSAIQRSTGNLVAIKSLVAREDDDWVRFDREAELMKELDSPYLVKIYEFHEGKATAHIVMEYVDGKTARSVTREEGLPFENVIRIGYGLAQGIAHLHKTSIVHRDIKPSNVLLPYAGGVKLTDLGIAKEVGDAALTAPGQGLGTLAFMAPEQAIDARSVDTRSDLYGFGATLYYLVAGRPPLVNSPIRSQKDLRIAVETLTTKKAPPLKVRRPETPAWLENMILKLLEKEPVDRIQTADEVVEAFGHWAELLDPSEERSMSETWHSRGT